MSRISDSLGYDYGVRDEYDTFLFDEIATETIIAERPYGRGVNVRTGVTSVNIHLPTPCSSSDLNVFLALIRVIARQLDASKIYCDEQTFTLSQVDKIEDVAKKDMALALQWLSNVDTDET